MCIKKGRYSIVAKGGNQCQTQVSGAAVVSFRSGVDAPCLHLSAYAAYIMGILRIRVSEPTPRIISLRVSVYEALMKPTKQRPSDLLPGFGAFSRVQQGHLSSNSVAAELLYACWPWSSLTS